MMKDYFKFLEEKLGRESFNKLTALKNPKIISFVGEYVELCAPSSLFIRTDSPEDIAYIREKACILGEEKELRLKGQTIHFDGPFDQARDKKRTKYFISGEQGQDYLNSINRQQGREEVKGILDGIMKDKEMFVCFFCLGPADSAFSILAVQITDSSYVAHSEDILYRPGYEQFKKLEGKEDFFLLCIVPES